jgi:hypothetical protein
MRLTRAIAISHSGQKGIMLEVVNWTSFDQAGTSPSVFHNDLG